MPGDPRTTASPRRPPSRPLRDTRQEVHGGRRPPPRRPVPAPARYRRRRIVVVVGVFAIMALLGLAAFLTYGLVKFNSIERVDVDLAGAATDQPQNFLIVGSDTRDISRDTADAGGIFGGKDAQLPGGQRADTILVARLDPKATSVQLLSVPRDLWVDMPGSSEKTRINATYNTGPQTIVNAVQRNLGIPINHYVEVNFESFKGLVEAIGGVPMYFDRAMYDQNTGLAIRKKGCYTLDPVQALAFARSRHLMYSNGTRWVPDETGDLGRITRQQVFLRHALAQVSSLGVGDLSTMRRLVDVAVQNVKLDDQLSTREILSLGRRFSQFDPTQLVTHRLPVVPRTTGGGASVLEVDGTSARPVLETFRGKRPAKPRAGPVASSSTVPNASVRVSVLNGTGTAGRARAAADELATFSFNVGEVGNAAGPAARTTLSYAPGGAALAAAVALHVTPAPQLSEDASVPAGTVQLVLGADFERIVAGAAPKSAGGPTANDTRTSDKPIGFVAGDPPAGVTCG